MASSVERLAMLDDVHEAGGGAVVALARDYGVGTRVVYMWLEYGFPVGWDQAAHELWRERFIRATGGRHLIGRRQEFASERGASSSGLDGVRQAASDLVVESAKFLEDEVKALKDGALSRSEMLDLEADLNHLEAEVARARGILDRALGWG